MFWLTHIGNYCNIGINQETQYLQIQLTANLKSSFWQQLSFRQNGNVTGVTFVHTFLLQSYLISANWIIGLSCTNTLFLCLLMLEIKRDNEEKKACSDSISYICNLLDTMLLLFMNAMLSLSFGKNVCFVQYNMEKNCT